MATEPDDFVDGIFADDTAAQQIPRNGRTLRVLCVTPPCTSSEELEAQAESMKADVWGAMPGQLPIPFHNEDGTVEIVATEIAQIETAGFTPTEYRELVESES